MFTKLLLTLPNFLFVCLPLFLCLHSSSLSPPVTTILPLSFLVCSLTFLFHFKCFNTYTRLDSEGVIKVADFGLSKGLYEKLYFRENRKSGVKLPFKWMALESLQDGVFSEKTDVVSMLLLTVCVCMYLNKPHSNFHCKNVFCFSEVVVWCDLLGSVYWRENSLPRSQPFSTDEGVGKRGKNGYPRQFCLLRRNVGLFDYELHVYIHKPLIPS